MPKIHCIEVVLLDDILISVVMTRRRSEELSMVIENAARHHLPVPKLLRHSSVPESSIGMLQHVSTGSISDQNIRSACEPSAIQYMPNFGVLGLGC